MADPGNSSCSPDISSVSGTTRTEPTQPNVPGEDLRAGRLDPLLPDSDDDGIPDDLDEHPGSPAR
jgi:hypothetical protein